MSALALASEDASLHPAGELSLPFDAVLALAREGGVREALDGLNAALKSVQRRASAEAWSRTVGAARAHALREFLHGDPFTFRCFAKPRGYAGDADALDYVLRRRELAVRASDPLAELHYYTTHGALARALLHRRDEAARVADEIALNAREPIRIFSASCGHLRECDRMHCLANGRVEKMVAFDADHGNLERVRRDYARHPIATHQGSVRQLAEGRHLFGDMDFVTCGGLLDCLGDVQAAELVRALFAMLRPGGTLLASAMLDTLPESGYAEAYMDWRIAYRTRESLHALGADLPADAVESVTYVESPEGTVGAIAIRRR